MDFGKLIGDNLNRLRTERDLTLGQLAALSGLSKAMLSDLEKGGGNPTINTLWKIANGLKVPYTRLLEESGGGATLVRREDAPPQQAENGQYRVFCYFKGGAERNFELFAMELDPQGDYTSAGHLAQAQEYIYVLEGRLTVETGGGVYHLDPGMPWALTPPRSTATATRGRSWSGGSFSTTIPSETRWENFSEWSGEKRAILPHGDRKGHSLLPGFENPNGPRNCGSGRFPYEGDRQNCSGGADYRRTELGQRRDFRPGHRGGPLWRLRQRSEPTGVYSGVSVCHLVHHSLFPGGPH